MSPRSTASGVPFPLLCRTHGVALPYAEYHFAVHLGRAWRFDFAWPDARLALEVDGGIYTRGRHVRPIGYLNDIEKFNAATLDGWRVLRCTPADLTNGRALDLVRRALEQRRP